MKDVMKMIQDTKIIAIIRGISSEYIINTVQALKDGGITCAEVTFSAKSEEISKDTLKSIAMVKEHFGDSVAIGAGTVLTPEDVQKAAQAGAEYMISPNSNEAVIKETKKLGLISIPGAMTPSEIVNAYEWGADIVKLFPAASLGLGYIKALLGPINHIPVTAVGGIDASNAQSFLDIGCIGVGVGGNLVNKKLIEAGDFETVKKLAQEYKLK